MFSRPALNSNADFCILTCGTVESGRRMTLVSTRRVDCGKCNRLTFGSNYTKWVWSLIQQIH